MTIVQTFTIMRRRTLSLVAALSVLALMLPASIAQAQTKSQDDQTGLTSPIEGSWIFTVHLTQANITFSAFASFAAGGTLLATGANDRLVSISPLVGSWKQIRPNHFSSTSYYFVFDLVGRPVATQRANIAFRLNNGDELVGVGQTDRCDLEGQNCVSLADSFQVSARRIVPDTSINQ